VKNIEHSVENGLVLVIPTSKEILSVWKPNYRIGKGQKSFKDTLLKVDQVLWRL